MESKNEESIEIDLQSGIEMPKPIYIQLAERLMIGIFSGQYEPGKSLPSIPFLAKKANVNSNTMQKAMKYISDRNLIIRSRRSGYFVTQDREAINREKELYIRKLNTSYEQKMQMIVGRNNEGNKIGTEN